VRAVTVTLVSQRRKLVRASKKSTFFSQDRPLPPLHHFFFQSEHVPLIKSYLFSKLNARINERLAHRGENLGVDLFARPFQRQKLALGAHRLESVCV